MGNVIGCSKIKRPKMFKSKDEAMNYVNEQIEKNKVVVFSKSYCPYCVKARKLLEQLSSSVTVIELDELDGDDGQMIQDALKIKTKQSTVPNIFINQKHMGGCDDVHALHKNGKLAPLLK